MPRKDPLGSRRQSPHRFQVQMKSQRVFVNGKQDWARHKCSLWPQVNLSRAPRNEVPLHRGLIILIGITPADYTNLRNIYSAIELSVGAVSEGLQWDLPMGSPVFYQKGAFAHQIPNRTILLGIDVALG